MKTYTKIEFRVLAEINRKRVYFDWKDISLNGRNDCIVHFDKGVFEIGNSPDYGHVVLEQFTGALHEPKYDNSLSPVENHRAKKKIFVGDFVHDEHNYYKIIRIAFGFIARNLGTWNGGKLKPINKSEEWYENNPLERIHTQINKNMIPFADSVSGI